MYSALIFHICSFIINCNLFLQI